MAEYDEVVLPGGSDPFSPPDLEEERRLGHLAAQLLSSEAYQELVRVQRDLITETFSQTPIRDVEGLQWCRGFLKILDDQDALLRNTVDTGKLAAKQLTEKQVDFQVVGAKT